MSEIGQDTGLQTGITEASIGTKAHIDGGVRYVPKPHPAERGPKLAEIQLQLNEIQISLDHVLLGLIQIQKRLDTPWYKRLWTWTKNLFASEVR